MKAVRLCILLLVLLLTGGLLLYRDRGFVRGQSQNGGGNVACCGQPDTTAPREIDFPYYSLRGGFDSRVLLVSDSPRAMDLTVAVRGLMGETVLAPMSIQPQQKLTVDLQALLTEQKADVNGTFAEGSVAVYFVGSVMPLAGQLTMTNAALGLIHESEMVQNDPGQSDIPGVLNGLWWGVAGGRDANIMVSNTGAQPVMADVFLDFEGTRHESTPLSFIAHETKVLSIIQLLGGLKVSPSEAPEGGITIVQRGPSPSLIAQGRVLDPATGFSTSLNFPLPQQQLMSALHASGVPGKPTADSPFAGMGTFVPRVILRNLLSSPQSVTITVEYPTAARPNQNGQIVSANTSPPLEAYAAHGTAQIVLGPLSVGPYATEDFSFDAVLDQLPLPLPYCSIRMQYSGPPGSAIAEVSSVDQKQDLVVDSRLANDGDGWAGSGAHPWHLDDETESVLFLTDESDLPARIGFQVQANGVHYYLTKLKLNPHETRAIDLRKLRDAQQADFKWNKIPAAATDGSVVWIRLDNLPVAGRLVVIARHRGMASNYDCNTCYCPPSSVACSISPPPPSCLGPHVIMQCTCIVTFQNCNGVDSYSDETTGSTWTTNNGAVATFSTTTAGELHAHAAGSASMTASYAGHFYPGCPPNCGSCTQYSQANVSNTQAITVANSGCPDHLVVESSSVKLGTCGTSWKATPLEWTNNYTIADATGTALSSDNTVVEAWSGFSPNTCSGAGNPGPSSTCTPYGETFPDKYSVGCNNTGGSCGWSLKIQQWQYCPLFQAQVVMATITSVKVTNTSTSIVVNGGTTYSTSSPMPNGTAVDP